MLESVGGVVDQLVGVSTRAPRATVLGAGTVGATALAFDQTAAEVRGDAAVGLVLRGLSPLVRSAPACRLLTPLDPIDDDQFDRRR